MRTRTRRETASGGQQQQEREGAREGSKDREKAVQAKEMGACSSNGVLRGFPDHPGANTSEGRTPHRAEAFVAMRISEDRSQAATTLHTTGMSQIQPDTPREGPAEH